MRAYFCSVYSTSHICTIRFSRSFLKVAIGVDLIAPAPADKEVVFCRVQQGALAELSHYLTPCSRDLGGKVPIQNYFPHAPTLFDACY